MAVESSAILRFESLAAHHIKTVVEIERTVHSAPWSELSFTAELKNPQSLFIVLLENGRVIGYAGAWLIGDESHITNVAVHLDHRGRGHGRRLMVELLKRSRESGAACATLEVRAGNPVAIGLYESMGFVAAARRKGYYPDNKEDAVVMWLHEMPAG
ncbi:MAG: ribosomal protein S18-alanine N-acetyltransferase [Fimbriimonadaceae bacterium]|nr:ribosomal protein S18-alanine N-acetyltransferase [Fimbriimonadaceae bacterium]